MQTHFFRLLISLLLLTTGDGNLLAEEIWFSEGVERIEYDNSVFQPDPHYDNNQYDAKAERQIYQEKVTPYNPRPLLELGYDLYASGPFPESSYIFGKKNPVTQQFLVYGDWLTIFSYVDNDALVVSQAATQLNLDIDWKLTGTERLHLFFRPLDNDGAISSIRKVNGKSELNKNFEFNLEPDVLFFEGELGAITSGVTDEYVSWDLPFAIGLMPLFFQNGIWMNDAFTGIAMTLSALNSPNWDISNYDITFFAGFDKISSAIANADEDNVNLYGITAFVEANQGYWELGYGLTQDTSDLGDQSYHNLTVAFSRRYGGWLSNSMRVIANVGQQRKNSEPNTADGWAFFIENSFITRLPSTWVPYVNLFAGINQPQSLARAAGAGEILVNTGIAFESAGIGGIPSLDASANDTAGGALGMEYLFSLNQQIVVELAGLIDLDTSSTSTNTNTHQYALGLRYQRPFYNSWIVRMDVNAVFETETDIDRFGASLEVKRKF